MITTLVFWLLGLACGIAATYHTMKDELREMQDAIEETQNMNDELWEQLQACKKGDLNKDGKVNQQDLSAFMSNWNTNRT